MLASRSLRSFGRAAMLQSVPISSLIINQCQHASDNVKYEAHTLASTQVQRTGSTANRTNGCH